MASPFPFDWSCGEFLRGLRIIPSLLAVITSPVPRNRRPPSPMSDTLASNALSRDAHLVGQVARGDERALGLLYDRFGPVLYAVAFRVTGEKADAEEVVMEAFAQAWREASRFDAMRGSAAAWLTMMARSRALDLVRSRARRTRITESAAQNDVSQGAISPTSRAIESTNSGNPSATPTISLRRLSASSRARAAASTSSALPISVSLVSITP